MKKPVKKDKFEKIRSQVERNKLLQGVINAQGEMTCKGEGDNLFIFVPQQVSEREGLIGKIKSSTGHLAAGETVIVNFSSGDDKYFMQSAYVQTPAHQALTLTENMYLLQRRAGIRVELEPEEGRKVNVIAHNQKSCFVDGDCLDISIGGALVAVQGIAPQAGDILKMVFHLRNKWNFEVEVVVKHVRTTNPSQFHLMGVEFTAANQGFASRMQMIMLELQRLHMLDLGKG